MSYDILESQIFLNHMFKSTVSFRRSNIYSSNDTLMIRVCMRLSEINLTLNRFTMGFMSSATWPSCSVPLIVVEKPVFPFLIDILGSTLFPVQFPVSLHFLLFN